MILKYLLCLFLLTAGINAKRYAIDADYQVFEVSDDTEDQLLFDNNIMATSSFIDNRTTSGWAYYEVQTNGAFPDWAQTYSAGFMEGVLAYDLIYDAYSNLKSVNGQLPSDVLQYINNQLAWMAKMVVQNPQDHYWNLVNGTLAQQAGLYAGYLAAIAKHLRPDMTLTFDQLYQVTYVTDLWDVMSKFGYSSRKFPSCSFLLRMTEDNLYVSHTTWSEYIWLLRMYKVLNLNLNNPLVQTKRMSYSAMPGSVPSQDDFYILDNNKVVIETSLETNNNEVYSFLHYDTVPYWVRIVVANLVYDTMQSWVDAYFAYRSGTYNNQWLLTDFNNYNASKNDLSNAKDIIWMVEEFYNLTSVQDVTQTMLIPQGYVASYNVPYNAAIQALSNDTTNYTNDPRAILFAKYAPGVKNIEDFKYVMRLNNHSDTGDYCAAIASRCDLEARTEFPHGAIDCKVTSDILAPTHQAWIIAGPTNENLPSFTWADWPQFSQARSGIVTEFDFDWVFMDPNHNFTTTQYTDDLMIETISY